MVGEIARWNRICEYHFAKIYSHQGPGQLPERNHAVNQRITIYPFSIGTTTRYSGLAVPSPYAQKIGNPVSPKGIGHSFSSVSIRIHRVIHRNWGGDTVCRKRSLSKTQCRVSAKN